MASLAGKGGRSLSWYDSLVVVEVDEAHGSLTSREVLDEQAMVEAATDGPTVFRVDLLGAWSSVSV